jgi:DNA-binding transcriptional ArsR family regulator
MKKIYSQGFKVKTKILEALKDDVPMSVTQLNKILLMESSNLRKHLKSMVFYGFVVELRLINPNRQDSKVFMYKAKNREKWEEYVLNTLGRDTLPENSDKLKEKLVIPPRNTAWWGLVTNGYL